MPVGAQPAGEVERGRSWCGGAFEVESAGAGEGGPILFHSPYAIALAGHASEVSNQFLEPLRAVCYRVPTLLKCPA